MVGVGVEGQPVKHPRLIPLAVLVTGQLSEEITKIGEELATLFGKLDDDLLKLQ